MPKGYAEGPAADEAERRADEIARGRDVTKDDAPPERLAVYGATADDLEPHFLGWADEIDADALFDCGEAWGLNFVRRTDA